SSTTTSTSTAYAATGFFTMVVGLGLRCNIRSATTTTSTSSTAASAATTATAFFTFGFSFSFGFAFIASTSWLDFANEFQVLLHDGCPVNDFSDGFGFFTAVANCRPLYHGSKWTDGRLARLTFLHPSICGHNRRPMSNSCFGNLHGSFFPL